MYAETADKGAGIMLARAKERSPVPSYWVGALRGDMICRRRLGLELSRHKSRAVRALGRFWLSLAAGSGDRRSMRALGLSYSTEKGRRYFEKSIKWLSRAVEHGCIEARSELGRLLLREGQGEYSTAAFYLMCNGGPDDADDAEMVYDFFLSADFTPENSKNIPAALE